MDKIMESKPMQAFNHFGQALGANKFVSALTAGMQALMGVIMVGAISQIIVSVLGPNMLNLVAADSLLYKTLYMPYHLTMGILSVWVVVTMAFNYARNLQFKSPIMAALDATICFMIVASSCDGATLSMSYLSSTGMFVGMLVVWVVVQIERFCYEKNIRIKMPDMVPQFLQDGFASILPLLFSVIVLSAVSALVSALTGGAFNLCSGFVYILAAPLAALNSVPGAFVLIFIATLLWCFGIHGTLIVYSAVMAITLGCVAENAAIVAGGGEPKFYALALMGAMACSGGTGNTLALAILSSRSKSAQLKAVGRISLVPGWFGINEPMTFGIPIMYNPIMMIPYILNTLVCALVMLILFRVGYLMPAWISMSALLPMGFGQFLTTLHWQNATFDYICVVISGLIWYPFFKVYEKQLVAREQAAAEED